MSQSGLVERQQPEQQGQALGPGVLEAVWRYRWRIVAATLVAAAIGYGASHLQPTLYATEARLLLTDPRAASAFGEGTGLVVGDGPRYVRNQAAYVSSTPVMTRASELLGGEVPVIALSRNSTVLPSEELDLITIRVLGSTPQLAVASANAIGQAYQEVREEEIQARADARILQLEEERDEVRQRIDDADAVLADDPNNTVAATERDAMARQLLALDNRIRQLSTDALLYGAGVELFEEATLPSRQTQPHPERNAAIAAALGFLAASGVAWWRAEQTTRADHPADAAPVLGAPRLGEVPEFNDRGGTDVTPALHAPHSAAGEAYQFIIATLEAIQRERPASSILVTSAGPGDGKTVTALNLAIAAVRDGRKVLLVDADCRARGLTLLSQLASRPGFTDLSDTEVPLDGYVGAWRFFADGVTVPFVPAGTEVADPAAMYRSASFRRGLQRLIDAADLVLVDTPPLLAFSDTVAIAGQFDGMIVVIERGTSMRVLAELRQRLDLVGVPLLGYVYNRARRRHVFERAARTRGGPYGYVKGPAAKDSGRRHARR